jgi:hypothetical protein
MSERFRDNCCYGWVDADGNFTSDSIPEDWKRDLRGLQIEQDRLVMYPENKLAIDDE